MRRSFDARKISPAFRGHELQWASYGIVDDDGNGAAAVVLVDDDGNPSPYGPLVSCTLQPSGVSIPCRLGGQVAGDGEADYYPFAPGDEVLVILPEGTERSGAAIIARMNQELDRWPTVVAGQDSTKNSFGFRRMRTPYQIETSAAYMIRNATTGSQIGIDGQGQVIVNDGDKNQLVIGSEAMGFTSGDGDTFMQLFPSDSQVMLGAGGASFTLDATETKFLSGGTISFATSGGMANQTAVTAEQLVAWTINLLAVLGMGSYFKNGSPLSEPLYPGPTPPQTCQAAIAPIIIQLLTAMAGPAPVGPGPGGEFLEFQGLGVFGPAGAIQAAFSNPLAAVDVTGSIFGFGRPGFKL